jgi:regulator of protease activity HflC (stomatin/prohibitin superfamily)
VGRKSDSEDHPFRYHGGRNADFGIKGVVFAVVGVAVLFFLFNCYVSVPAGHVAVASLFGKVNPSPYAEGLHVPVNPLYRWNYFDARQKTHLETAGVPSQDQLQTTVDVSVQYRLNKEQAAKILRDTGTAHDVINVHLVPKLRSVLREQGKSIKRAEDFFLEETQEKLQSALLTGLVAYLDPMGVEVQAVLLRDIRLPPFITKAIEAKKEREQAVERQKAELMRFRTEQEQKVAAAEAEKLAAEAQAKKIRVLADAKAYEIEAVNKAMSKNSTFLKLEALKTLSAMGKDPAAKIYFMDSDSPNPVPLMHIGDQK